MSDRALMLLQNLPKTYASEYIALIWNDLDVAFDATVIHPIFQQDFSNQTIKL